MLSGKVFGGIPERPKGSDCKSDAKASVVRIHLPPPGLKCSNKVRRRNHLNGAKAILEWDARA